MEMLAGGDLYNHCDRLPIDRRFLNLTRFFDAIQYLHNLGIVHRDLKGENILLDREGIPKITDLGLATSDDTTNARRSGTLEYMAPEVIDNKGASKLCDIYSIGVILYRIATGRLLVESDDPLQVISMKHQPERVDFSLIQTTVRDSLEAIIRKCIDPEPNCRFQSVTAVKEELANAGLLQDSEGYDNQYEAYFHYHFWSYNHSFVRQWFRNLKGNCLITDHHQASASHLLESLSDYLKWDGVEVELQKNCLEIDYRSGSTHGGNIKIVSGNTATTEDRTVVDYPELQRNELKTILSKVFSAEVEQETIDLFNYYSSGNIALLQTFLSQMRKQTLIREKQDEPQLTIASLATFKPSIEYYSILSQLIPSFDSRYTETLSLLAVDKFDNRRDILISAGLVSKSDLDNLAQMGILRKDDFQFLKSYIKEYFYQQTTQEQRTSLHKQWIDLLKLHSDGSNIDTDKQLFHHYYCAGVIEEAVKQALLLAERLKEESQPEQARKIIAKARSLKNLGSNKSLYMQLIMRSGDLARDAGDLKQALRDYAIIVRIATRLQDWRILAESYKDLGDIYRAKCDYRRGNEVLEKAVNLYGEIGDELELSHCFNNIGNIHWLNGDLEKAEVNYETALEVQRRLGIEKDIASSLNNLGSIKLMQHKYDEGIPLYKESMQIKRRIKDYGELARTANNISIAYFENGELQLAKDYIEQSLEINKSLGAAKELIYNYENLYEIEIRRGNRKAAKEAVFAGLRLAQADDYSHRAGLLIYLANLFVQEGQYERAGTLLNVAAKLESAVTDKLLSMRLSGSIAEYLRLLADYPTASRFLNKALEDAEKLGDTKAKANFIVLSARLSRDEGAKRDIVISLYQQAMDVYESLEAKREQLVVLLDLIEYYLSIKDPDQAEKIFADISTYPDFEGKEVFEPQLYYIEGLYNKQRGMIQPAISKFSDSVSKAKEIGMQELLWQVLVELGESYKIVPNYERALKCYLQAFEVLKGLASTITEKHHKRSYLADPRKENAANQLEHLSGLVT